MRLRLAFKHNPVSHQCQNLLMLHRHKLVTLEECLLLQDNPMSHHKWELPCHLALHEDPILVPLLVS